MDYDQFYRNKGFSRTPVKKNVKRLVQLLPRNARNVLDLGAGDGRHTVYLAERGFSVTAVDNSREAISILEKLARRATFKITPVFADITKPEQLPQEQFNAIVCTYVIQDLSPEQARLLAEYVIKHTVPQGYLAFATFLGKYRTLFEALKPLFNGWNRISGEKGKTHTVCRGLYDTIELLLQKPAE